MTGKIKQARIAEGRKLLKKFEEMTSFAELKALSGISLERPLTDAEFERMMELKRQFMEVV